MPTASGIEFPSATTSMSGLGIQDLDYACSKERHLLEYCNSNAAHMPYIPLKGNTFVFDAYVSRNARPI